MSENETTTYGDVAVTIDDDYVAIVEMRRPPHNFFDVALISAIGDAMEALDGDPRARAAVLCSEGKNFCAGAALEAKSQGGETIDNTTELYAQAARLFETRTPCVAAVQGAAIGGGLGVAMYPDFRVAAPEARFAANFARLGFHQGFGLSVSLPHVVGNQAALDLFYTGRRVDGEEAVAIGLADKLASIDELRATAVAMAREIAHSAPLAIDSIRQTMRGHLADEVRRATVREADEQARLRVTADFAEGIAAMSDRRLPNFQGK